MSGGPVFTNEGLCGVLSSGASDSPYSLASFIAACYYLKIDCDIGEGFQELEVLDLVSSGHIRASGSDFNMRNSGSRYEIEWPSDNGGAPPMV